MLMPFKLARLQSGLLDRSRPLWETYAGLAVTKALRGDSAVPAPIEPPRPQLCTHPYQLGKADLAGAALGNAVQQAAKIVKSVPATLGAIASVAYPVNVDGKRHLTQPQGLAARAAHTVQHGDHKPAPPRARCRWPTSRR